MAAASAPEAAAAKAVTATTAAAVAAEEQLPATRPPFVSRVSSSTTFHMVHGLSVEVVESTSSAVVRNGVTTVTFNTTTTVLEPGAVSRSLDTGPAVSQPAESLEAPTAGAPAGSSGPANSALPFAGLQAASTAPLVRSGAKYPYGIVLNNRPRDGLTVDQLKMLQRKILELLARYGVQIVCLCDTLEWDAHGQLVFVLQELSDEVFRREHDRLHMDEYLKLGIVEKQTVLHTGAHITPAFRLALLHRLVQRVLEHVRTNPRLFGDISTSPGDGKPPIPWTAVVVSHGPLHDVQFNHELTHQMFGGRNWLRWDMDELFELMREHFGETVAFYFYWLWHYTQWLIPLMLFMVVYYIIARFVDWAAYNRGLAILGFLVCVGWAPLMNRSWQRKSAELSFRWGMLDQIEEENVNPRNPEFKLVKNDTTGQVDKVYDPNHWREKFRVLFVPFMVLNLVVLVVIAAFFVQWYVFSKLAPTCECCQWYLSVRGNLTNTAPEACTSWQRDALLNLASGTFVPPSSCRYYVNCFTSSGSTIGTDRWSYILIQGIALGIVLDVLQFELFAWGAEAVTIKESWPTERQFERKLIRTQFGFIWVNMFFWFWWITFVYVPFGTFAQQVLVSLNLGWAVPGAGWRIGVINIDEAFVTPLIVTQAINLALETLIPWLFNKQARNLNKQKALLRKRLVKVKIRRDLPVDTTALPPNRTPVQLPSEIVSWFRGAWQQTIRVMNITDDTNQYDATEVQLQLGRSPFHPRKDYLDMLMQIGYILQFTVAWALMPVPAVINNVLELRGDVLKLMFGTSRPVPTRAKGVGPWVGIVNTAINYSLPVLIGLIVIGTGQLEYWVKPDCIAQSRGANERVMGPDLTCFSSWGYRLLAAVAIWLLGIAIKAEVRRWYRPMSEEMRANMRTLKTLQLQERQERMLPKLPRELVRDLRVVFLRYAKNGTLDKPTCWTIFTEINNVAKQMGASSRDLTGEEAHNLFDILDVTESQSISFPEAALALSRSEADPLLKDTLQYSLCQGVGWLADQLRSSDDGSFTSPTTLDQTL